MDPDDVQRSGSRGRSRKKATLTGKSERRKRRARRQPTSGPSRYIPLECRPSRGNRRNIDILSMSDDDVFDQIDEVVEHVRQSISSDDDDDDDLLIRDDFISGREFFLTQQNVAVEDVSSQHPPNQNDVPIQNTPPPRQDDDVDQISPAHSSQQSQSSFSGDADEPIPCPSPRSFDNLPRLPRAGVVGRRARAYPQVGFLLLTGQIIYGRQTRPGERGEDVTRRCRNETRSLGRHRILETLILNRGKALRTPRPVDTHYAGVRQRCEFCGALNSPAERNQAGHFQICCKGGKISLNVIVQDPRIQDILTDQHNEHHENLKSNIRKYNISLSFASFKYNRPTNHPNALRAEEYVFYLHGVAFHYISHPEPQENQPAVFGQLYFLDPQEARDAREQNMNVAADINPQLLETLELVLREVNAHARCYQLFREYAENVASQRDDAQLFLYIRPGQHRGIYDASILADDIAAIYPLSVGLPQENVELWVQRIRGDANNPRGLQSIPIYHHQVDTYSYPLIFHTGRGGWNFDLRSLSGGSKVTFTEFVQFHLAERLANGSPLLNYGRLLQQIICDWGHRQEQLKLRFLRALQLTRVEFNVYRDMQEQIFGLNVDANDIPVDGQNDDVPVLNYGRGVNIVGNEPPAEPAEVAAAVAAATAADAAAENDDVLNR
ncbi:hypothetical protein DMENIID0001_156020 [Sergentomyia squamirostris]